MANNKFWVPDTKWQLVGLLCQVYPNDRAKFNRLTKKRLKEILFFTRKKFYEKKETHV